MRASRKRRRSPRRWRPGSQTSKFRFRARLEKPSVLYGSVTSADVADALTAKGFEIDRRKLHLVEPIKKLGDFEIPLRLHREVTVQIKLKVVAEGK